MLTNYGDSIILNSENAIHNTGGRPRIDWRIINSICSNNISWCNLPIVQRIGGNYFSFRSSKTDIVRHIFIGVFYFIKFILIVTTTFFFLHATFATSVFCCTIKIYSCFRAHAIMYFHSNAARQCHVNNSWYGEKHFFHYLKVKSFLVKARSWDVKKYKTDGIHILRW